MGGRKDDDLQSRYLGARPEASVPTRIQAMAPRIPSAFLAACRRLPVVWMQRTQSRGATLDGRSTTGGWLDDVDRALRGLRCANAIGSRAYNAVETRATLKFTGEFASLPAWDFPRVAVLLYRSKASGNWVVVSTSSSCQVWRREGEPRPPYWQHELVGGEWRGIPLSEESIGKNGNLFHMYDSEKVPRRMTVQEAMVRQSSPTIGEKYRRVTRDPDGFNCME